MLVNALIWRKKNIYILKPQQWFGKYFILFKSERQCEKNRITTSLKDGRRNRLQTPHKKKAFP